MKGSVGRRRFPASYRARRRVCRRSRQQAPAKREDVAQGGLHVPDVVVNLWQPVIDFLVRMLLAGDGIEFQSGLEVFQAVVESYWSAGKVGGKYSKKC